MRCEACHERGAECDRCRADRLEGELAEAREIVRLSQRNHRDLQDCVCSYCEDARRFLASRSAPLPPRAAPCCDEGAKLTGSWVERYKCPVHGWQDWKLLPDGTTIAAPHPQPGEARPGCSCRVFNAVGGDPAKCQLHDSTPGAAAPSRDEGERGRERFYCAEWLRRWALKNEDAPTRALLANLAYGVAKGLHVDAVINGPMPPPRADIPGAAELHGWTGRSPEASTRTVTVAFDSSEQCICERHLLCPEECVFTKCPACEAWRETRDKRASIPTPTCCDVAKLGYHGLYCTQREPIPGTQPDTKGEP
jgi:hypothetical protein